LTNKLLLSFLVITILIGGGSGAALAEYIPYGQDNPKGVFVCGLEICTPLDYKAFQKHINDAQLGKSSFNFTGITHHIFQYSPSFNALKVNPSIHFSMDIHIPNHVDYFGVILSYDDFQTLKSNVGIFAVLNIVQTSAQPNINYCDLANAIWNGQDQSFQAKYSKDLVVPVSCNAVPVPEFNNIAIIVMIVAITSMVIISRRSKI
jgi:hypothetical protein